MVVNSSRANKLVNAAFLSVFIVILCLKRAKKQMTKTYDLEATITAFIFFCQRLLSLLFIMQWRKMPTISATKPTASSTGPAIFSGFSPIDELPGQCAINVIVAPMKIIPPAKT